MTRTEHVYPASRLHDAASKTRHTVCEDCAKGIQEGDWSGIVGRWSAEERICFYTGLVEEWVEFVGPLSFVEKIADKSEYFFASTPRPLCVKPVYFFCACCEHDIVSNSFVFESGAAA